MVFVNTPNSTPNGIDLTLFDPIVLRDLVAFESALCSFEQKLFDPGVDKVKLVDDLLSVPNLFEVVSAAVGESSAEYMQGLIRQSYPTRASEFSGSHAQRLLDRLAHFAVAFSLIPSAVGKLHEVQAGSHALTAIASVFGDSTDESDEQPAPPVTPSRPTKRRRNFAHTSQREQKKAARSKGSVDVDPTPFKDLNLNVPASKDESNTLTQTILRDQRTLLDQFLSMLRKPEFFDTIKAVYVPTILPELNPKHPATPTVNGSKPTEDQLTATTTSSVFPMVQPLRAALHFDSPEGFGEWRIMIPSSAHRGLRDARKRNPKLFDIIIKKIKELSNGHFSDDNQKKLNMSGGIPIFEAKMTSDTRLVYQIDCNQDFETGVERQVIQVYGIYTHTQVKRFNWDSLASKLAKRGSTYRERCIFRSKPRQPGKNVIAPGSFPPQPRPSNNALKLEIPGRQANDEEERQKNEMLEKFAVFSKDFLTGIMADDDGAYVFQMSPTEQKIVKHVGSSYVLGRSGTGKTTSMLYKILGMERAWSQHDQIPDATIGKPRQLFVTKSKMLAKKVEEYYCKLAASHGVGHRPAQQHAELLINLDEETGWRRDLPRRFSQLKDDHFPLFLTFDELCEMLGNEFDHASKPQSASNTSTMDSSHQQSFVSWRRFKSKYWPHLPQTLTKHLEAYLVFGEIMGIVKGSEKTLASNTGYLDSDTYFKLSHRGASTFASQRENVYKLFEAYLRLKKDYGDSDAADRTQKLLRSMRELGVPGQAVDYIYIDEAQDNLLIDAMVLRSLCRDSNGLFWAGDTAQTISAGSAFRFNDLKAFLWRIEETLYQSAPKATKAPVPPKAFHLAINYRSHAGIIDFAQTVIQIITKFWPDSIDILKEEKGDSEGVKPIVFTGWTEHSIPFEQHLFGDRHHQIEFGANQCILVRDELARDRLRGRVGEVGMILTLQESKGLEFNDVLLYNFFEDSDVSLSNWRVVSKIIQDDSMGAAKSLDARHNVVCRELKFLYVAITRARNNVWIADSSNKGNPMKDVWLSRNQIEICTPNDPIPKLAVSSAQEEWAERGRSLFKNGTYRQAIHCFERAGLRQERNVAFAYSLQEEAYLLADASVIRNATFQQAAEAFLQCAESTQITDEARAYYRQGGRCLTESGDHERAGSFFLSAEEYTASAQAYRKADMFERAVHVVQQYEVEPDVATSIVSVAKLHYFKEDEVEKVFELGLFQCPEEARDYAEVFGFDRAEAEILEKMGEVKEAAALHFREGRYTDALHLLLSAPVLQEEIQELCVLYLLQGLWRFLSIGIEASDNLPSEAKSLLQLTEKVVDVCAPDEHDRLQIEMFTRIARCEWSRLPVFAKRFLNDFDDKPAFALCLDHVFGRTLNLRAIRAVTEVHEVLQAFLAYVEVLWAVAFIPDPCHKNGVQRLFGFITAEDNMVTMFAGTLLHRTMHGGLERNITKRATEVAPILQNIIKDILRTRVKEENRMCKRCPALFPCPVYTLNGWCGLKFCRKGHGIRDALLLNSFNLRLRILMLQVLIFRTAEYLVERKERIDQRRIWLQNIYDILHPSHHALGSFANINLAHLPEAAKAIPVINHWVEDRLFSLQSYGLSPFFLNGLTQMSSLAFLLDRLRAQRSLGRIPCVQREPPGCYLRDGGSSIIDDILTCLDGSGKRPIIAGIFFLKQVISARLHIDLNVICYILEFICYSTAITRRMRSSGGSLHNTILPRQWLLNLPTSDSELIVARSIPIALLIELVTYVRKLFLDIFSADQNDFRYLFFEYQGWDEADIWQIVYISLSRICRALCLLSCNMGTPTLRDHIVSTIRMLAVSQHTFPAFCSRYAEAKNWDDLWYAIRASGQQPRSTLDELLFLQDEKRGPPKAIWGFRTISYREWGYALEDIRAVASGSSINVNHFTAMEVQPKEIQSDTVDNSDIEHFTLPASHEEITSEDEALEPTTYADDNTVIDSLASPEEIRAATTIQRACRNFLQRKHARAVQIILTAYRKYRVRRDAPLSSIDECRNRLRSACRTVTHSYAFGPYKTYFLDQLPHALVCLEKMHAQVSEQKDKIIQRLRSEKVVLEKVDEDMQRVITLFKHITALKTELSPLSEFHQSQDIKLLKEKIQKLEPLVSVMPRGVASELAYDLRMAMRSMEGTGELQEGRKKAQRPQLNTDDLDLSYY